jgi:hypothetical protein
LQQQQQAVVATAIIAVLLVVVVLYCSLSTSVFLAQWGEHLLQLKGKEKRWT